MVPLLLLTLLASPILGFGNECKQIINEHFFNLNTLESEQDYLYLYEQSPENKTQIFFNFCQPTIHSCSGTTPEYHMMKMTTDTCMYLKPVDDSEEFGKENGGKFMYLISKTGQKIMDGIPADGIGSLFQGIFCLF